jgi:hypothetical protein
VKKTFSDLPEWIFEMDEISAGVYEVVGHDAAGHYTSAKGIDLDELIEKCRAEAGRPQKTRTLTADRPRFQMNRPEGT